MTETMAPENDAPKLSVNFDLTDIEDIDEISGETDAEPSSDDDTFISYKKKKPTKRRYKDEVHARIEQKENNEICTSSGSEVQVSEALSTKENDEKKPEASVVENPKTNTNLTPQMCPPTDHFNELERKMNGPGWKITSSSASCSENELGANERDEFTFKMCQIIKKSHRYNKKNKQQRHKRESDSESMVASTTAMELAKSENESGTDDEKQALKFCCGNVPLVALGEDDL